MAQAFDVQVRYTRIKVKLDELPEDLRARLKTTTQVLATEVMSVAVAMAQSELQVHTGNYLKGFSKSVRTSKSSVTGTVRNRSKVGHLVELGAKRPAHEILPNVARAMMFAKSAGQIFAARVHAPASEMPAFHVLKNALDDERGTIVSELKGTVADATSQITEN